MQGSAESTNSIYSPQTDRLSITAIILTYNEDIHIARCLSRITPLVERVVVVDSFSTDCTVEIARSRGAEVLQHAWKNYSEQFQWGLDKSNPETEWVMRLDADEYLEVPLIEELRTKLPTLPAAITGVNMKRKVIFRDTWIRHGGYYPSVFLRLWRNGAGRIEQRWMDEHMVLSHGETITMTCDFVDHNLRDITWWTDKHNRYATRQMVDFINLEYGLFHVDRTLDCTDNRQAKWKRFLRDKVFGRAPLYVRGVLYFFLRYILRLGFLDGRQGFVFHFLQGCWSWILVDVKIDEARAFIRARGIESFKKHLRVHHNIDV
jgi:glycosyltransferase involved in cell wall biosynthesis